MTTSKAQLLAVQKYRAKTYDTIGFDVPKGKREEFKVKAAELGLSLAKFLFLAAESYGGIDNESVLAVPTTTTEPALTREQRKILDAFDALPADTKKALIKVLFALSKQSDNA